MVTHLWLLTTSLLLVITIQGGGCLRNVSLSVKPQAVQRGRNASFLCQYDLEGAELYSVKFYRGRFEFYRYTPGDTPAFKVFRLPGITVDLSGSDEHQVMLRDVGFNLSGNLSCEVTVEAPKFTTITVYNRLLVVEFPKGPPEITTDQERYFPGDVLKANCTSPASRPPASLSFLLNNSPVGTPDVHHIPVGESALLHTSFLSLSMQLFPSHYVEDQLILKCTAFLSTLYRNTSEVSLGARPKEPIPEKVTSHNDSQRQYLDLCVLLVLMFCGYIMR